MKFQPGKRYPPRLSAPSAKSGPSSLPSLFSFSLCCRKSQNPDWSFSSSSSRPGLMGGSRSEQAEGEWLKSRSNLSRSCLDSSRCLRVREFVAQTMFWRRCCRCRRRQRWQTSASLASTAGVGRREARSRWKRCLYGCRLKGWWVLLKTRNGSSPAKHWVFSRIAANLL